MSAFAVIGGTGVTAAAMRAAADLIEESGIGGLSVTCNEDQISIQVCEQAGDAPARAGIVAALASLLTSTAYQHDSPACPSAWLQAHGQIRGIPVRVYTPLQVRTTAAGGAAVPVAVAAGGQAAAVPAGQLLPAGWRWATALDEPAGTEVA